MIIGYTTVNDHVEEVIFLLPLKITFFFSFLFKYDFVCQDLDGVLPLQVTAYLPTKKAKQNKCIDLNKHLVTMI